MVFMPVGISCEFQSLRTGIRVSEMKKHAGSISLIALNPVTRGSFPSSFNWVLQTCWFSAVHQFPPSAFAVVGVQVHTLPGTAGRDGGAWGVPHAARGSGTGGWVGV